MSKEHGCYICWTSGEESKQIKAVLQRVPLPSVVVAFYQNFPLSLHGLGSTKFQEGRDKIFRAEGHTELEAGKRNLYGIVEDVLLLLERKRWGIYRVREREKGRDLYQKFICPGSVGGGSIKADVRWDVHAVSGAGFGDYHDDTIGITHSSLTNPFSSSLLILILHSYHCGRIVRIRKCNT